MPHLPLCEPSHMVGLIDSIFSTSTYMKSLSVGTALIPSLTSSVGAFRRRFSLPTSVLVGVLEPDLTGDPVALIILARTASSGRKHDVMYPCWCHRSSHIRRIDNIILTRQYHMMKHDVMYPCWCHRSSHIWRIDNIILTRQCHMLFAGPYNKPYWGGNCSLGWDDRW